MVNIVKSLEELNVDVDAAEAAIGINAGNISDLQTPPAIAGFAASQKTYISDDPFHGASLSILPLFATGVWGQIGPTGSPVPWTALDILPVGTKWIEVSCFISTFGSTDADPYETTFSIRHGDSVAPGASPKAIAAFTNRSGLAERDRNEVSFKIPVNADGEFGGYWTELGTANSGSVILKLIAFGVT
jgi:hypothetical protein